MFNPLMQPLQSWKLLAVLYESLFFGDASRMNSDAAQMKTSPAASLPGNAINSMGVSAPPPVENTPVPASQPSPRVFQERVHVSVNTLPEYNSVSSLSAPHRRAICRHHTLARRRAGEEVRCVSSANT